MRRSAVLAASMALACGACGLVAAAAPASAAAWRNVPTNALAYEGSLDRVDVVNTKLAWAVGRAGGKTKVLRWLGSSWAPQTSPVDFVPTDVAGAGPKNAWAVGLGPGLAVAMHWNGFAWAKVGYPLLGVPSQVAAAPDGTVFSLSSINAGNGGISNVLRWNGSAFVKANVPLPPSTNITALDVRAKNNVWLAGTTTANGTQVTGLVLHFDGTTWKRMPLPGNMGTPALQGVLHKIAALAPNNVYVSRVAQQAQIVNAVMHWNGSKWRTIPTPLNAAGVGLTADGAGGVWVTSVGNGTRSLYFHWNRTAWSTARGPVRGGKVQLGDIDQIPGTRGAFSVGSFPNKQNKSVPILERFV